MEASTHQTDHYALLIGNMNYEDNWKNYENLPSVPKDLEIQKSMLERYGFNVE